MRLSVVRCFEAQLVGEKAEIGNMQGLLAALRGLHNCNSYKTHKPTNAIGDREDAGCPGVLHWAPADAVHDVD